MSRIPKHVQAAVVERSGDYCEACGMPARGKMDFHHRKLRSQGGQDTVENLMWVHDSCHTVTPHSIHQNPARSERLGHIVLSHKDPAFVVVQTTAEVFTLRA